MNSITFRAEGGEIVAQWASPSVPRVGDSVVIQKRLYKVLTVIWYPDQTPDQVEVWLDR